MMTEKRFSYLTGASGVLFYDNEEMIPYPKVIELLNDQEEKIKLLTIKCYCQDQEIQKLLENIQELENSIKNKHELRRLIEIANHQTVTINKQSELLEEQNEMLDKLKQMLHEKDIIIEKYEEIR